MPRQRTHHSRTVYVLPDDFPERLKRLKQESGLPWAELHRRLGIDPKTMRRWRDKGVRPGTRYMMALRDLTDNPGLGHTCSPSEGCGPVQRPAKAGPETQKRPHT